MRALLCLPPVSDEATCSIQLIVIGLLEFGAIVARKYSAKQAVRAKEEGLPQPAGALLADLCSDVSFFLLFLLYPGSSAKIFHAMLCVSFDGAGEDGQTFLRMDFSIDCNSPMYLGLMFPYAL